MSLEKVTLGTTLLGGAATGATFLSIGSSASSMEKWRPLSEDTENNYKDKYAENYKRYLVGVGTAITGKAPADNDLWWKWSYINRYGYSNGNEGFNKSKITKWEDLKEACKSAYKGTKGETETEVKEGNTKYKEDEIWKYCSPAGTKIKTIAEIMKETGNVDAYTEQKIGKIYKDVLVSSSIKNNWFWNLKQKELKEYDSWDRDSLEEDIFKEASQKLKNGTARTYDSLQNACEVVYGKNKTEIEKYKKYLFKFCSLTGEETTIVDASK